MKKLICSLLVMVLVLTATSFSTGTEMVSAHESKSTYEPVAVNTIHSVQESDISETVTVIPMVAEEVSVEPEGMYGDRITRCYVKDELVQLVKEELENRTNEDVVFFRTGHYHSYGVPMFQVGAHYFSSYD